MNNRWAILTLTGILYSSLAFAHHSYSQWSPELATVKGTVKEFQWTNPHIWILVMVPGADGQLTEWGFESAAPGMLHRNGSWKASSIKAGDKVTLTYHPKKDGSKLGSLVQVVLPDQSVLKVLDLVLGPLHRGEPSLTGEGPQDTAPPGSPPPGQSAQPKPY